MLDQIRIFFGLMFVKNKKKDDSSGMVDKNNNILKFNEDSVKALKKQIDTNLL